LPGIAGLSFSLHRKGIAMSRIFSMGVILLGVLLVGAVGSSAADTPAKTRELNASREIIAAAKAMPEDLMGVLAIEGITDLLKDIDELSKGAGHPEWSTTLKAAVEAFAGGIDRTKPFGAAVVVRNEEVISIGMIPVTDLAVVLQSLQGLFGPAQDVNGLKRVGPFLVKSSGGYAFVASQAEHLEKLPDPAKILAPLVRQADVALAAFPQRIPDAYREQAFEMIEATAEMQADRRGGGNALKRSVERMQSQRQVAEYQTLVEDAQLVGIEVSLDAAGKKIALEMTVLPEDDTDLAETCKKNTLPMSAFAPLVDPSLPLLFHQTKKLPKLDEEDYEEADEVFEEMADELREELADETLPQAQQDERNKLVDEGLKLMQRFVRDETLDGILLTSRAGETFEVIGALRVPDGKSLDAFLVRLGGALAKHPQIKSFKPSQAKHRGAEIHTLTLLPAPQADRNILKQWLGSEEIHVHFACTPDTVWMCAGPTSWKPLTAAMDKCAAPPARVPMQRFTIALSPMVSRAAEITKSAELEKLVGSLTASEGLRAIEVSENGQGRSRVEIDFAVIRAIAAVIESFKPKE